MIKTVLSRIFREDFTLALLAKVIRLVKLNIINNLFHIGGNSYCIFPGIIKVAKISSRYKIYMYIYQFLWKNCYICFSLKIPLIRFFVK